MFKVKKSELTGQKIKFDEKNHIYVNDKKEEIISVSTLINLFKPKFDPDGKILAKCAEKRGISKEELQAEWDKTRDDANAKGHKFHSDVEHFIKTGEILDNSNKLLVQQIKDFNYTGKLFSETIVYSEKHGVAGTVDVVQQDLDSPEIISIKDFKTNKKLDKKDNWRKYLLYPLHHLDACNFNVYTMQLSSYAFILEDEFGFWIKDLEILYINPRTNVVERHPVQYRRKEVKDMFKKYQEMKHKKNKLDPFEL